MVQVFSDDDVGPLQKKIEFFFLGILAFFLIVICRLFYLQVLQGAYYRLLSDQISVREEVIRAPRGLIVDRNGRVIADNRSYYEIAAIPQHIHNKKRLIQSVARLIPVGEDELKHQFDQERLMPPFLP